MTKTKKQKKKSFHICRVINLNVLYSRRIVSACLSSEPLKISASNFESLFASP